MNRFFTRKRLAMTISCTGVALMGVDLLVTRNFFVHIGELMTASIVCLVVGVALDRNTSNETDNAPEKAGESPSLSDTPQQNKWVAPGTGDK